MVREEEEKKETAAFSHRVNATQNVCYQALCKTEAD